MKALALFSGGLDSMLAIRLIKDQNIEVVALYIDVGFGAKEVDRALLESRANEAGASFEVVELKKEYLDSVLFNPKYGYGKGFNPCIDCHGFMFRMAKELLPKYGASFLITGEVVGQRPMSQRAIALKQVSKLANDEEGLILRPLSAKLLELTLPEKLGWVDREKLLDISGRNRKVQLKLAKEFGFKDYESPSGGCLLTLSSFSNRMKDSLKHEKFTLEDIELLKFGRHLRLPNGAKLIIGKNEEDNASLRALNPSKYMIIELPNIIGPVAYLHHLSTKEDTILALRLVLTYAKSQKDKEYEMSFKDEMFYLKPFESKDAAKPYFVN